MTAVRTVCLSLLVSVIAAPAGAQFLQVERLFRPAENGSGLHSLSMPDPSRVPDIANSLESDACDVSATLPDGVVNADDILCQLWGAGELSERHGVFSISRVNPDTCRFETRTAFRMAPGGEIRFVGVPFGYVREQGYLIRVSALAGQPEPLNRVRLRSDCDLLFPPRDLANTCPIEILSMPYDALRDDHISILCGDEGVDWSDDDGDGQPDACGGGLFDPPSAAPVVVQHVTQRSHFGGCSAWSDPFGEPFLIGTCDTEIGRSEAILFSADEDYAGRVWEPEGGPCP